jgi:hypothetical protein
VCRVLWLLIVTAGCDRLFNLQTVEIPDDAATDRGKGLDGTSIGGDSTIVVSKCATFGPPTELSGFGAFDNEPAERGDDQELWFVRAMQPGSHQILLAPRTGTTSFGPGVMYGFSTGIANDLGPTVTADGKNLLFISDRSVAVRVYEAVNDPDKGSFATATFVSLLDNAQGIAISADGLTLYFDAGDGMLRKTERPTRTGGFGTSSVVSALTIAYPSVTADEQQVFYLRAGSICRATRANTSGQFTNEEVIAGVAGGQPSISFDGKTLIYSNGTTLVQQLCL